MKFDTALRSGLVGVLGVAVVGATIAATQRSDYAFFDPLIDVKRLVSERYVEPPADAELQEGAIRGMIEALGDPYTVYVPAADRAEFNKGLTGEYVGIGASINIVDGWLVIVSPLEDSPAFRAGLMAEDKVLEIDGVSTHNLGVDKCMQMLQGTPGTTVNLVVERKGERVPVSIVRDRIKTRSVKGIHRDETDPNRWQFTIDPARRVAYVRLTQFTPGCADEVRQALLSLGADKPASEGGLGGLVLDLRWNPGGLLSDAVEIADMLLREGTIVSTKGRAHAEQVARARDEGTLAQFPIVVLLNGSSASASEVLAGALAENDRAIVLGTRSFGKGSVQSVYTLDRAGGAELKITEQAYYLPSGRSLHRTDDAAVWGVDPSPGFFLPLTDAQAVALLEVRRNEEIIRAGGSGAGGAGGAADAEPASAGAQRWSDPEWILDYLKDPQLSAAVRALQGKIDSGTFTPASDPAAQASAVAQGEAGRLIVARKRLARELSRVDRRLSALDAGTAPNPEALWPEGADVAGGTLEVRDKDGNVVATLRITDNDLQRWLMDAGVRKPEADEKK